MGIATIVSDYLNNTTMYNLVNRNANETVAGNAMKMGSCVDGNGNMNFTTVTNYVNKATQAGPSIKALSVLPKRWAKGSRSGRPCPLFCF